MLFSQLESRGHEQVCFFNDTRRGFRAIIAIHNTVRGPSLGGCRMRAYVNEEQAIEDVLRLSEGMSYKSAVADLDLGGGKACIWIDPKIQKGREELFRWFGTCVEQLGGRYITAEDMGTSVADMALVSEKTRHVTGVAGKAGDPSPWTALGVFLSIKKFFEIDSGKASVTGRKIAVQGVGHVGFYLTEMLTKEGAEVVVCDTNEQALEEVKQKFSVRVVALNSIYDEACDVFSPNAIGQTINPQSIQRLNCKAICGAANNQLLDASVYALLEAKRITYCPDFVVNSGGVINVGAELIRGGYNRDWVQKKVERIPLTLHEVLERAKRQNKFTESVALEVARERIKARQ